MSTRLRALIVLGACAMLVTAFAAPQQHLKRNRSGVW